MANPTQEQQFANLANIMTGNNTAKASKTVDYKCLVTNKAGEIRNIGYINLWNRFSEVQLDALTAKLSGATLAGQINTLASTTGTTVAELKQTISDIIDLVEENNSSISIEISTSESTTPDDEF